MKTGTCSLALVAAALAVVGTSALGQVSYESPNVPNGPSVITGISGGNVVGHYTDSSDSFFYDGSTVTTIADPNATSGTLALGVSGATVVGSYAANNRNYGFIESGGSYTTIDNSSAVDLTVAGIDGSTIVGSYTNTQGRQNGFFSVDGVFTSLSAPGGFGTQANAISGNTIVGTYKSVTGPQGFTFQNGVYLTLNDPLATGGTIPTGISGSNIVGYYYTSGGANAPFDVHGFLFDGTNYTTIDDPDADRNIYGILGTYPVGISGNTIVGSVSAADSAIANGFVATTATPEPMSFALALIAAGTFALLRWRRTA